LAVLNTCSIDSQLLLKAGIGREISTLRWFEKNVGCRESCPFAGCVDLLLRGQVGRGAFKFEHHEDGTPMDKKQ
jgi:hypothetical protein